MEGAFVKLCLSPVRVSRHLLMRLLDNYTTGCALNHTRQGTWITLSFHRYAIGTYLFKLALFNTSHKYTLYMSYGTGISWSQYHLIVCTNVIPIVVNNGKATQNETIFLQTILTPVYLCEMIFQSIYSDLQPFMIKHISLINLPSWLMFVIWWAQKASFVSSHFNYKIFVFFKVEFLVYFQRILIRYIFVT